MAKKAGGNTTTTWISLSDARALVIEAYGATQKAETLLKKWLGEERVRWTCKLFEPARVADLAALQRESAAAGIVLTVATVASSNGDPAFWRADLEIKWAESWARKKYMHGGAGAYTVTVVREDVLAQLPAEPDEPEGMAASWIWLAAEASQMRAAKKIPALKSEFARELAKRMLRAAIADHSLRPIQWESIRNDLSKYDLWPPDLIK